MIRQPIVVVLAHVDHGKTTLLDKIRQTSVAEKEAGGITQNIGATLVPIKTIDNVCGALLRKMGLSLKVPGLLFIDTPGHEAFSTMRGHGGRIADIAVLLIDINEGVQPQTIESLEILKKNKVPFIIAANKIDRLYGWQANEDAPYLKTAKKQTPETQELLEKKLYELIGEMSKHGFDTDIYTNVQDFTQSIVIVPVSGKTGEGVPDLLMLLTGLSQKYMDLGTDVTGPGKGTIIEVKEERGLGTCIDTIIYDGVLYKGDTIALGGRARPIITKVKALLEPGMEPGTLHTVEKVSASRGVKISASGLEDAVAGSTVLVVKDEARAVEEIIKEMKQAVIENIQDGVTLKTGTVGELEALMQMMRKESIPVSRGSTGAVAKEDVFHAESTREKDRCLGVVFAFNTKVLEDAREAAGAGLVTLFESDVIYQLIEEYKKWRIEEKKQEREEILGGVLYPMKLRVLPGYIFRKRRPAIMGVEILEGVLKTRCKLMKENGRSVGKVKEMQKDNSTIQKAEKGDQAAISVVGITVGRQINEGDIIYSNIPLKDIQQLEINVKEKGLLEEIKTIKKRGKESFKEERI